MINRCMILILFSVVPCLAGKEVDSSANAESGLSMWTVAAALFAIIIIGVALTQRGGSGDGRLKPSIELHAMQMKFMEDMEKLYCSGNTKGKGIRCIIDYMRESTPEHTAEILAQTPKYTESESFVPFEMDLYERQIDWLASQGVIPVSDTEGGLQERDKALSKAFRAMLDFAMGKQAEGNEDKIKDIFDVYRCLNCRDAYMRGVQYRVQ